MTNRTWFIGFLVTIMIATTLLLAACKSSAATDTPEPADKSTAIAAAPTRTSTPAPTASEMPTALPETATPSPAPTEIPTTTTMAETSTSTPTDTPMPSPAPTETPTSLPATATPTSLSPQPTPASLTSIDLLFARFEEPVVDAAPAIQHEAIAPDLSNVRVPFALSEAQRERLARDGFVVSPGVEKEFFTVYEKARYANVPIFVTSDSLLHVYHLLFGKVLRTAEVQHFIPLLRNLNAAMLTRADELYQSLEEDAWKKAAQRTVAYFGVASRLLDPDVEIPDYAADLVEAELALIEAADRIEGSPLFPELEQGEDYTQYIPRGHYTRSEDLKAYFRSMMWYGRMTFLLAPDDPEVSRAETRPALLLVYALRTTEVRGRPALEAWADLYQPTVFFVGRSDDLTPMQYGSVMDQIYGPNVTVASLSLNGDALLDAFIEEANNLPPPRILGMVIMDTDDVEASTKGLRFMGQRFVPDAYIFRQLIYRNVSTLDHRRGLPKGLDLLAAMGSERAYQLLDGMGETTYANYPEQMVKLRDWVADLSVEEWTETLYNAWLYVFHPLLEAPGAGHPAFMLSPAWVDKQLNTVLGSWAELKHDTILYAKQVYAELGAGPMPPEPLPPKGYVEPVPQFYARLTALTAMTREGLAGRGLLVEQDDNSLQRLEELTRAFQTMAEKELRGEPLTEKEYATIRFYGGELEHLTMAAADRPEEESGGRGFMEEEPQAAVIADVATDPASIPTVLEEAVGRINGIHVVVPVVEEDGTVQLQVAKGGVFSYYEFPWPADDRLTDEKWRQMLDQDQAPPPPAWTESFFTHEGESSDLAAAILRFQKSLVNAVWFLEIDSVNVKGAERLRDHIDALRDQERFEGRRLMFTDLRSIDWQAEERAVVTVRETWQDELYAFDGYPGEPTGEPLALRGPYTLDVTYTLDLGEVTRVVYANEPPAW